MPMFNHTYLILNVATTTIEDIGLGYPTGQLLYYLFIVGVTIVFTYLCTKFIAHKMGKRSLDKGKWLDVLDIYNLSRDNKLYLMKIGLCLMVVADSRQGITVIRELSADESQKLLDDFERESGQNEKGGLPKMSLNFAHVLKEKMADLRNREKRDQCE